MCRIKRRLRTHAHRLRKPRTLWLGKPRRRPSLARSNARPRFPRLTLTTPACVTVDVIGRVDISHLGKLCRLLTNPQRCPLRQSSRLAAPCVEHEWSWQAESRALTARRNMFLNAQSANSPKRKSAVTRPTPGAIAPPGRDECSRQRYHPSTV